jgi:hypothetical protein
MAEKTVKLICTISKLGASLSQISEVTGLTIEQVKETLGQAIGLTAEELSNIYHMRQEGRSLEQISQESGLPLEVLMQFVSENTPRTDYSTNSAERMPNKPSKTQFIYCCKSGSDNLLRTNVMTAELAWLRVPGFRFKHDFCWSELPGGSLLITGGWNGRVATRQVVKIDTLREFAVSSLPPMHTARWYHVAVYHSQYLYVLGGFTSKECERYELTECRWEVLPNVPAVSCAMSAVVLDSSLYTIGGRFDRDLDIVQKLSLDSLTWQPIQLKLPQGTCLCPCFKIDNQVYLVIETTLYSFTPLQVKPIKSVPRKIQCNASYYSRGTLYYAWRGELASMPIWG